MQRVPKNKNSFKKSENYGPTTPFWPMGVAEPPSKAGLGVAKPSGEGRKGRARKRMDKREKPRRRGREGPGLQKFVNYLIIFFFFFGQNFCRGGCPYKN